MRWWREPKSALSPVQRRIPFGRHRHEHLGDIPSSYLKWLRTIDIKDARLQDAIERELFRRDLINAHHE